MICQRVGEMNYTHTFTHLNTKIIGHLSFLINCCLLPESACIVAAILNWVKDPIRLLSAILYLCGVASWGVGYTKYEWKIFYEFLHLTFYNYCWIEIMLLILVYWRKLCYSMFNPFYVILLHIFMWYCSSWEMVEPMSINSHVMKQSGGHWLVCSNYSYWIIVIPEPRFFLFVFVLWSWFFIVFLKGFSPMELHVFCTGEHSALYWLGKN